MPSNGYESLCQGNFVGVFGNDRDAYLSLDSGGFSVRGTLVLQSPDATYRVDGSCQDNGDSAEISIALDGGHQYVGQVFVAEDGEVYMEATQGGSNITFEMKRQ